ncbi:acyltransferase domain-containing protein [Streptomyces sp. NPDC002845]
MVIAAVNGPRSVVVSGDRDAVTALSEEWAARGRWTHVLRVDAAPHSPHVDSLLDEFGRTLHTMELRRPRIPLVSGITARPVGAEATTPEFWAREFREPVRFADAADRMRQDGVTACVEPGPGAVPARRFGDCLPEGGEQPLVLSAARNWRALRRS